jgi:hypothetical protein
VSEKLIAQQQAGFVRRAKTSRRNTAGLVGTCPGGKFLVVDEGRGRVMIRVTEVQIGNSRCMVARLHSADEEFLCQIQVS